MSETLNLKNCSEVKVRERTRDDLDRVFSFYQKLPEDEAELAQINVHDIKAVEKRFDDIELGGGERLIAICRDTGDVVAEVVLDTMRLEWMRKTGELRYLMLPEYRIPKVMRALAQEAFLLAARHGLNHLLVNLMDKDEDMLNILTDELNFVHEATQKASAFDKEDKAHDIYVLTFSLRKMWMSIEEMVRGTDSFSSEH